MELSSHNSILMVPSFSRGVPSHSLVKLQRGPRVSSGRHMEAGGLLTTLLSHSGCLCFTSSFLTFILYFHRFQSVFLWSWTDLG